MYKIFANGDILHHPMMFEGGYIVDNPAIKQSLNTHGSMEFTMLPEHPLYDSIAELSTIITVYDDTKELFRGRVLHCTKDFYNNKSVYVEGELAFLVDSVYRPFTFSGGVSEFFGALIENHNAQVEENKRFEIGMCTVTDPNDYIVRESVNPMNTWDLITEKLIKLLGGYIRVRVKNGIRYIDYIESYNHTSNQRVEFGKNLLEIEDFITSDEVVTCLIPYGVQYKEDDEGYTEKPENGSYNGNRLTIESVNGGVDYITNDLGISLYGKVWGTKNWDDVTLPENLLKKATEYLTDSICESVTLTINALNLHLADADIASIDLGDDVQVFSIPHDINRTLICTSKTINLTAPDKDEITLGGQAESVSRSVSSGESTQKRVTALEVDSQLNWERIERLKSDYAEITELVAEKATIEQLNAVEAYITNLDAEKVSADELEAAVASIHKLLADYATIDHLEANYATIERLEAVVGSFDMLLADYATIDHLETNYATINKLNADLAEVKKLFADYAKIKDLDAKYANIDFANINMAAVEQLFAKSGIIKDLVVGDTSITGELVGVTIKGDLIEGNTVKADKLVVKGEDGLYYKLNVTGETVEAQQTDENSLDGSIITAKSITATKINVKDLVAFGATIGGYHITDNALYSGVKTSADNTTRGVYMDSDGQFAVGDASNYLRFFKGSDGKYKLELSASSMTMSTGQTVEDAISNVQDAIDKARVIGGRNLLKKELIVTSGTTNAEKIDDLSVRVGISSENGDTYFYLKPVQDLDTDTVYTFSCTAENVPDGASWTFRPAGTSSELALTINANGRCSGSGTLAKSVTAGDWMLVDDSGTRPAALSGIVLRDFKLESGSVATDYTPAPEDVSEEIVKTSASKIEQFKGSIRLVVTDPDGNETSIKLDEENHITLTGTVLAQVIDVAKLFAGDITATGKIQFKNGLYSLLIDEAENQVALKSWTNLNLEGGSQVNILGGGNISISTAQSVGIDGQEIRIEGTRYKHSSFRVGRDKAALTIRGPLAVDEYAPIISAPTANGTWDIGTYNDDTLWVSYITNDNYEAGNNTRTARMAFQADNRLYLPGGLQLLDGAMTDYVVDKGFSNVWNYQKFASGRAIIWARITVSSVACTTALGDWYRTEDVVGQIAWPFTLAGIPSVTAAYGGDSTGALAWLRGQSTVDVFSGAYCVRPTSATLSGYMQIHVFGWWK